VFPRDGYVAPRSPASRVTCHLWRPQSPRRLRRGRAPCDLPIDPRDLPIDACELAAPTERHNHRSGSSLTTIPPPGRSSAAGRGPYAPPLEKDTGKDGGMPWGSRNRSPRALSVRHRLPSSAHPTIARSVLATTETHRTARPQERSTARSPTAPLRSSPPTVPNPGRGRPQGLPFACRSIPPRAHRPRPVQAPTACRASGSDRETW